MFYFKKKKKEVSEDLPKLILRQSTVSWVKEMATADGPHHKLQEQRNGKPISMAKD